MNNLWEYFRGHNYISDCLRKIVFSLLIPIVIICQEFTGLLFVSDMMDSVNTLTLGRLPDDHFKLFMNMHCIRWTYNTRQLQHMNSQFCGHYCIFFCAYQCASFNMQKIASCFGRNIQINNKV